MGFFSEGPAGKRPEMLISRVERSKYDDACDIFSLHWIPKPWLVQMCWSWGGDGGTQGAWTSSAFNMRRQPMWRQFIPKDWFTVSQTWDWQTANSPVAVTPPSPPHSPSPPPPQSNLKRPSDWRVRPHHIGRQLLPSPPIYLFQCDPVQWDVMYNISMHWNPN